MKLRSLSDLLRGEPFNNDNLHRIAISNLESRERQIQRWWAKKYKIPLKPYDEHTIEELIIEMLEDYYDGNPQEIERFLDSVRFEKEEMEWDGKVSPEYEEEMRKRLKKINERNRIDESKYVSDEKLTPEQEREILESLGMNLKNSSKRIEESKNEARTLGEDEFDDNF